MKRVLASVGAAVLAVAVVWVNPMAAQATIVCSGMTKHWSVRSGDVAINVAWIDYRIEVCTNGGEITRSSATNDHDETGPGTLAGFVIKSGSPALVSFDSGGFSGGHATYFTGMSLRDCLAHVGLFCSPAYDFSVRGKVHMLNALYVNTWKPNQIKLHGRIFEFTWWWVCRNMACTGGGVTLNGEQKRTGDYV